MLKILRKETKKFEIKFEKGITCLFEIGIKDYLHLTTKYLLKINGITML
jgi:hypothetical protein